MACPAKSPILTPTEAAKTLLYVPGRPIPPDVVANRAKQIRRAMAARELLSIPYLAGKIIRHRTTLDAVLSWDHAQRGGMA